MKKPQTLNLVAKSPATKPQLTAANGAGAWVPELATAGQGSRLCNPDWFRVYGLGFEVWVLGFRV